MSVYSVKVSQVSKVFVSSKPQELLTVAFFMPANYLNLVSLKKGVTV